MDSKQIDAAMRAGSPVLYDGRRYKRIVEYVSWYDASGRRQLSAVLLAEQGNYTVKVPAEKVEEVRWSLRALRLCGAVLDRSLWDEDCPSCQLVAYHPEYLREHPEMCYQYCPDCGKPRTAKAWAEWERRVQHYAEEGTL